MTLPLTFLVTEKNDRNILGQVSVPLSELTSFRTNHPLHRPLQPHKKCPNAVGELVFEAWISAGHIPPSQHVAMTTPMTSHDVGEDADDVHKLSALPAGLRKLKDKLTAHHSPTLHRSLSLCCRIYSHSHYASGVELITISVLTIPSIWHNSAVDFYVLENIYRKFVNLVTPPTGGTTKRLMRCKAHLVL